MTPRRHRRRRRGGTSPSVLVVDPQRANLRRTPVLVGILEPGHEPDGDASGRGGPIDYRAELRPDCGSERVAAVVGLLRVDGADH